MKRFMQLPAMIAAAIVLCIYAPSFGAQPVVTSLQVPLAGIVDVPLSDNTFDQVALAGMVHVVTYVAPPNPIVPPNPVRIHINLDQVTGVGASTGSRYNATGANRINLPSLPTDPINLSFDLRAVGFPPDPIAPPDPIVPLDITFTLNFSVDLPGRLESVIIGDITVPVP